MSGSVPTSGTPRGLFLRHPKEILLPVGTRNGRKLPSSSPAIVRGPRPDQSRPPATTRAKWDAEAHAKGLMTGRQLWAH